MELRRLNDKGIAAFREYLEALKQDPRLDPPMDLLTKPSTSESLSEPIHAEPRDFHDRMDFACWLHDAAENAGVRVPLRDAGFWAWLSLALFDQVCPENKGKRKVGGLVRYLLNSDWKRRYRHLLATPYLVFYLHLEQPTRALVVLNQPLHILGELTEQFASRQELISCPGTMGLASRLFVDPRTHELRTGSSGEAARRLGKLMNQYTRTWDLPEMEPRTFARMLPKEFSRFVKAAESQAGGAGP